MTEEAKQARREYMRQWRQQHKDAVRESNSRYWEKRAQKMGLMKSQRKVDAKKKGAETC